MKAVFPTPVGMNRNDHDTSREYHSVPHVCGDEPDSGHMLIDPRECSPRPWG